MIYHGYDYDFDKFRHPAANGISEGSNPLYDVFNAASMDGSFLFQKVNQKCLDIPRPARESPTLETAWVGTSRATCTTSTVRALAT